MSGFGISIILDRVVQGFYVNGRINNEEEVDIKNLDLNFLGKFDVIMIDPPWEEYKRRV